MHLKLCTQVHAMNICNKYQHETFLKGQEAQLICSYMTASVRLKKPEISALTWPIFCGYHQFSQIS